MKSGFQNWSDIAVFLAVCRCGSTMAASKTLGMAQPTVARRIEALEHALRITLFERDTRGFHPTAAARRLIPQAEAMEAAAGALAAEAEAACCANVQPIKFTAPRVNFTENLSRILTDFTAENPGVQFELISTYDVVDLMAGEADVALRITHKIDDERLICRKLTMATSSLYVSESYAKKHGFPASVDDLDGHCFAVMPPAYGSITLNRMVLERIDPAQIVSRCTDVEAQMSAVKAGFGVGVLPTPMAEKDATLIRCFPPPEGTATASWLIMSPEAYKRPMVKAFSAFFATRFKALFKSYAGS
ncbi:MAG: LysR family transcriptional regulator [Rhodobacteraceae bacterium]|nr:LysR family transcriptional regulator [Paracoccaceae bacterium]